MAAYDIVIIGCGPGGGDAAVRAAQLGARVCVVEKRDLGGTCVNRGCIPTKAILKSAHLFHDIERASEFGINVGEPVVDFAKVMERKSTIVSNLSQGIEALLDSYSVDIVRGEGRIAKPGLVEVKKEDNSVEQLDTQNIIIATGSEPGYVPIFREEAGNVINSDGVLASNELPKSVIIIGGGVIGSEIGCMYNAFGVDVTIVEILPFILSTEDGQIARYMQGILSRRGIQIFVRAKITDAVDNGEEVIINLESGQTLRAEKAILCVGRARNSGGIGLEDLGIEVERGRIKVNERQETGVKGIYAMGDVCAPIQLAHVSTAEGMVAVANCMGQDKTMDHNVVPSGIFTWPEIGSVGLRMEQARKEGIRPNTGRFLFASSGRAASVGETEGFVKVLADPETDKILGVHIIGERATELIHEAAVAMKHGLTTHELAEVIHSHPTMSESVMEAMEDVHDMSVHVPKA
ncbi:dihydrolipoyl dehydrogenase [Candidatus Poribacteria bacterium]